MSTTEQLNEIATSLLTSCVSLLEKIQTGTDNYSFLSVVKKSTEDTHRIFTFVKNIETPNTAEKEELLTETITVKNVVIKLIQQARLFHKNAPPNSPAATPAQLQPLRNELGMAMRQLRAALQRFSQVEILKRHTMVSSHSGSEDNGQDMWNQSENTLGKDVAKTAVECLQAFADMSAALQKRVREPFAETLRNAITLVNQLVTIGTDDPASNQETLMRLRQDLVSLISHSRMYFVNPDDDYIKNTFYMFKEKVELAIRSFIPEDYTYNIIVESVEEEPPAPVLDDSVYEEYNPDTNFDRNNNLVPEIRPERKLSASSEPDLSFQQRNSQGDRDTSSVSHLPSDTPPRTSVNIPTNISTPAVVIPQESPRKFNLNLPLQLPKEEQLDTQKEEDGALTAPAELPPPKTPRRNRITEPALPPTIEESQQESNPDQNPEPQSQDTEEHKNGEDDNNNIINNITNNNNNNHHSDELSQLILEVIKNSLGTTWDSLDSEKLSKFEQNLRGRVDSYKLQILNNQNHQPDQPKKPETIQSSVSASSLQSTPAKQVYVPSLVSTNSSVGLAGRIKQPPPAAAPKNKFIIGKENQTLFKVFDLSSASVSSPRMKIAKKISASICSMVSVLYQYINDFSDPLKGYLREKEKLPPLKPTDDLKSKLYIAHKALAGTLRESMDNIINIQHVEPGTALETVRQRVKEFIYNLIDKKGEPYPIEEKLLTQGQYLRFMKQLLLKSVYYRTEKLYFTASNFLTVMRDCQPSDPSQGLHLLIIGYTFTQIIYDVLCELETFCVLYNYDTSQNKKNKAATKKHKEKEGESIWKEKVESNTLNKDNDFRAGSLNSLILRMTDLRAINKDCISTFATVNELFAESKEVWDKIEDRYNVPKNANLEADQINAIRMRVTNLLVTWLKTSFHSIEPAVLGTIDKFAEKTLKKENTYYAMIRKELDSADKFHPFPDKDKGRVSFAVPEQVTVLVFQNLQPYEILHGADSKIVAEQITILEFDIYRRIGRTEVISQKWARDKYQILARNVSTLVQRSDRLAHFVATSILLQKRLKDRAKVLASCIRIAAALLDLNNFNGLMGVLMGLTLSSVQRLRHTWARLNPKYEPLYKQLTVSQDPSNSFKSYRESLKAAGSQCLPYFTLFLSDLTFMDEGNPDLITVDDMQLINFPKHEMLFRTIKSLEKYQQQSKFDSLQPKEPFYTMLYQMPGLEEKELYNLSLEREPRNIQLKDLELKERQRD